MKMVKVLLMVFIVELVFILSALYAKEFEWCQYKFFTQPRKWNDACAICRQNNKTLAQISDTSEAYMISDFLENSVYDKRQVSSTFWIGTHMMTNSIMLPGGLLLSETNRNHMCHYMKRNYSPLKLNMEKCTSSRQFLCKASTFGSNHRHCYKEQSLKPIFKDNQIDRGKTDTHYCDSSCEKDLCVAYKTDSSSENTFICTFYTYTDNPHARDGHFFIKDILDTSDYPEVTATKMCDINSNHLASLPSSNKHLTTEQSLETSVQDHTVESYYSTPVLDDSTFPTSIITRPTIDQTVTHVPTSWTANVKSKITTDAVGTEEHSEVTVSERRDMSSRKEPLSGSTTHLTTEHTRPTTDLEVSSPLTSGVSEAIGVCTPSSIFPPISSECYCGCQNSTNTTMTNEQLVKKIQQLRQQLLLNKETLSSWKRKHTSAKDDRTSAKNIGYVGVAFIIAILVVIVMMDVPRLVAFIKHFRTHKGSSTRRFTPSKANVMKAPKTEQPSRENQPAVPMVTLKLPSRRRLIFLDNSSC